MPVDEAKKRVLVPKFNPKGTQPKVLYKRFYDAYEACFTGYQALRKNAPEPQDYPEGGAATADGNEFFPGPLGFEKATEQHKDRMDRMAEILDELEGIVENLRATGEHRI